tara:strand:- start:62 stop:325 length:264 start_codon:yes stop_codon:yes gene_type:complete
MVFRCELCDNFRGILQFSNLCDVCYEIRSIIKCYDRDCVLECLKENFIVDYRETKKKNANLEGETNEIEQQTQTEEEKTATNEENQD